MEIQTSSLQQARLELCYVFGPLVGGLYTFLQKRLLKCSLLSK